MRRAMVLFASIPCISLFAALQAQAVVHAEQEALSTPSTDTFCWADFDADGLDDLYIARKESPGSLLRNTGHGDFKDVTDLAAPSLAQQSNFSVWHDYNEDGYPDLYLVRNGKNLLYENICSATITPPH